MSMVTRREQKYSHRKVSISISIQIETYLHIAIDVCRKDYVYNLCWFVQLGFYFDLLCLCISGFTLIFSNFFSSF